MADTPLPSVATVNDAQLAAMLEVYTDVPGYKKAMVRHIVNDIRRFKQGQIQVTYQQELAQLNAQEAQAMADVETLLQNLINPP